MVNFDTDRDGIIDGKKGNTLPGLEHGGGEDSTSIANLGILDLGTLAQFLRQVLFANAKSCGYFGNSMLSRQRQNPDPKFFGVITGPGGA